MKESMKEMYFGGFGGRNKEKCNYILISKLNFKNQ